MPNSKDVGQELRASSSRRSRLSTLPVAVRGSGSVRKTTTSGTLKCASWPRTCSWISSISTVEPSLTHDDRGHLLTELPMGHPDDGHVGHGRVLEQNGLHLRAVHVLATTDHDVLEPVDHVDEALVVDVPQVAGVEPAVPERLGRGLGPVPVAASDAGAPEAELADLVDSRGPRRCSGRRHGCRCPAPVARRSMAGRGSRPPGCR